MRSHLHRPHSLRIKLQINGKNIGLEKLQPYFLRTEYSKNINVFLQINSCDLFQNRTYKIPDLQRAVESTCLKKLLSIVAKIYMLIYNSHSNFK